MHEILTFDDVLTTAYIWKPTFVVNHYMGVCAHIINKPHEDYPQRISQTEQAIEMVQHYESIYWYTCKEINSFVMYDQDTRGKIRNVDVRVGSFKPPSHLLVRKFLSKIFPVTKDTKLYDWYRLFETIHPFRDGNGRVGGIIVAAMSFQKDGWYVTPKQ